jgi:hypothetical protein
VKQLEAIASSLQQMTPADQDELRRYALRVADGHPSPAVADEIRSLVDDRLLPTDED